MWKPTDRELAERRVLMPTDAQRLQFESLTQLVGFLLTHSHSLGNVGWSIMHGFRGTERAPRVLYRLDFNGETYFLALERADDFDRRHGLDGREDEIEPG